MAERDEKRSGDLWVLDTETKGTGANMVPLDRVLAKRGPAAAPEFSFRKAPPRERPAEPAKPREFKVVDVMSRAVLAKRVGAAAAIHALEDVRSIVDVTVYVWEPVSERWRMLTLAETRALWERRRRE
jgi:hypothetical protein